MPLPLPSGIAYWLHRWYPSSTLLQDPLLDLSVDGRYVPIPIAGWKFTPRMAAALLAMRKPTSLSWSPSARLAVIVPIRDREAHLATLIPRLKTQLISQGINHRIVVVEQEDGKPWNKGVMLNVGMQHAADYCDYYCLHDVDAIPVEANYLCASQPIRLVTRLIGSKAGEARPPRYFGGVITLRREQAYAANGFSNHYWGWGKEDDDFLFRLLFAGFVCFSDSRGLFEDLHNPAHQHVDLKMPNKPKTVKLNRKRRGLLVRGLIDPQADGLNTLTAEVLKHADENGYERLLVRP